MNTRVLLVENKNYIKEKENTFYRLTDLQIKLLKLLGPDLHGLYIFFICHKYWSRFLIRKSRTQDNLRHQRRMLSGLSGRLLDMSARFPQLNYLIQKIAMRKRRDTGMIEKKTKLYRCDII